MAESTDFTAGKKASATNAGNRAKQAVRDDKASSARVLCDISRPIGLAASFYVGSNTGDPKTDFPETYEKIMKAIEPQIVPLMDSGVGLIMVSSEKILDEDRITITPGVGNPIVVIGILNTIQSDLKKAGVTAVDDPDYVCPNIRNASLGLIIKLPKSGAVSYK